MVHDGWALAYRRYSDKYDHAERGAKAERLGMWSGRFTAPWDWRWRQRRQKLAAGSTVRYSRTVQLSGIRGHLILRCGEPLKTYDAPGAHMKNTGAGVSQKQAATDAGMSRRQKETAVRVANVPAEQFDAAMESDSPAPARFHVKLSAAGPIAGPSPSRRGWGALSVWRSD